MALTNQYYWIPWITDTNKHPIQIYAVTLTVKYNLMNQGCHSMNNSYDL